MNLRRQTVLAFIEPKETATIREWGIQACIFNGTDICLKTHHKYKTNQQAKLTTQSLDLGSEGRAEAALAGAYIYLR